MSDEQDKKLAEVAAVATRADGDTEALLADLHEMVVARREDPDLKKRYERTRDDLAALLKEEGPRYFIDENGDKRYAYAVQPEPVEVDVDEVIAMYERGELSKETIDKIAPRKIDKEALRRAVSKKAVTRAQFVKIAKLGKGTAYVQFSDPIL